MDIYSIAIAISVILYILVGNYAGRRVKGIDDYFVAGRQAPTVLIVGTLTASLLSTNTFLAETGMAYTHWAGPWMLFPPVMVMGYIYGALFFGRYLRRSRAITVADFLGQRFDRRVQIVAGLTIVLGLGGYLLAVTQGAAVILSDLTALSYTQALLIAWASYTAFTIYSGSKGVVLTDTMMFFLFATVTLFGLIYIVDHHGGWATAFEGLVTLDEKPNLMAWHGMTGPEMQWKTPSEMAIWQIVLGLAWGLVVAVSPWQSSRYLIARNEQVVIRSACIAAVTIVSIQVGLYATAATVNLSKPDIEPMESTMIWAATNILPTWLGALLLAGLMAAALSSATTFLSLVGFSLSHDILPRKESTSDAAMLRFSRFMMLGVGLTVLVIALVMPLSICLITNVVGPSFASSWGPVAFMSVWSDKITSKAAFWGMVVGFTFNVIPRLMEIAGLISLPVYLHPIIIGSVSAVIVIIYFSRQGEVTEQERTFRKNLHVIPEEERDPKATFRTTWAAWLLAAFGISVAVFFATNYVVPYQTLSGLLLPDGSVDWSRGEAIEAIAWALLCTTFAVLAHFTVKRSYASKGEASPANAPAPGD